VTLYNLQVQGGDYTHVLHDRYQDKAALEVYYAHADNMNIQMKLQPVTEDRLAVDWGCVPCGPYIENIGAKRITLKTQGRGFSAGHEVFRKVDTTSTLQVPYSTTFLFTLQVEPLLVHPLSLHNMQ